MTKLKLLSYGSIDWVKIIGVALVLATILNGSAFYLKRIGFINKKEYDAYWTHHMAAGPYVCGTNYQQILREKPVSKYLFENKGKEIIFKMVKDFLTVGFILLSLIVYQSKKEEIDFPRSAWPIFSLLLVVIAASVTTYLKQGGFFVLLGLRSFMFLLIALLGMWFVRSRGMQFLAGCTAILIVVQLLTTPFELTYGLPFNGCLCLPNDLQTCLPARLAGTLVKPNSLGIFAICALAFYHDFSESKKYMGPLIIATVLILLLSGSATGLICMVVFLGTLVFGHLGRRYKTLSYTALIALLMIVLTLLPRLVGRPDLLNSLFGEKGRVEVLQTVISSNSPYESIFGNGIGYGTNAALNMFQRNYTNKTVFGHDAVPLRSDSTITAMFWQIGIIGVVLFYTMLFLAMVRQNKARLFYLTIILTSMTINITELFPVIFLLGVALASTFLTPNDVSRESVKQCQAI